MLSRRYYKNSNLFGNNKISNLINFFIRRVTTQKMRLLLQEIQDSQKKIFYSSKLNGIDYLTYILSKRSLIPYELFPKKDAEEIKYFLKVMILSALLERLNLKDFEGRWEKFEEIRKEVGKNIKFNPFLNQFCLYDFKSVVYPDTGVFPDNLCLSIFRKSNKKVCFDLGAFIGDSAFVISKFFDSSLVYAFEPDPANFTILKKNILLNKLRKRVFPIALGVGLKDGLFFLKKGGESSKILKKGSKDDIKVKVVSIDSFVKKKKIEKVDFIKMDIEGLEFDALKGGVKTLKRDKPDLLIAIYHKGEHFFEIPAWLKEVVPQYNLRFLAMNGASPIIERYIAASIRKI